MLTWKRNRSAFTLIELLVVVIIVAVLAAVGLPLLSGNVQRARLSEADSGLGTIRTALRAHFAENVTYAGAVLTGAGANLGITTNAGISPPGDLDGRFFDDNDYTIPTLTATTFCAQVVGGTDPDDAPKQDQVAGVARSINELGRLCNTGCPCAGGG